MTASMFWLRPYEECNILARPLHPVLMKQELWASSFFQLPKNDMFMTSLSLSAFLISSFQPSLSLDTNYSPLSLSDLWVHDLIHFFFIKLFSKMELQ